MTSKLQSVQPVGVNADFVKDYQLQLMVESGFKGSTELIKLEDGSLLFKIERDLLTAKHRTHFIDGSTSRELFEMTKEKAKFDYLVEDPSGSGQRLLDITIESPWFGGPTIKLSFPNLVGDGAMVCFEFKVNKFSKQHKVMYGESVVAEVEEVKLGTSIRVAPNVDPLPVVAILMALFDRAREKTRGKTVFGHNAINNRDFYGAGMGTAAFQGAALGGASAFS